MTEMPGGTSYLEWVERVMGEIAKPRPNPRELYGITQVGAALGLDGKLADEAIWPAIKDLERMSLVENRSSGFDLRLTQEGLKIREGARLETAWPAVMKGYLSDEQQAFLRKLIDMSEDARQGYALVEYVTTRSVFEAVGWPTEDISPFYELTERLEQEGYVERMGVSTGGYILVRPTYLGIVRTTQQVRSEWQAALPELIQTWETTSVEFKRELSLKGVVRNAEFVRDMLALATTQSSGRRLMVIGFDPKTHEFEQNFNPKISADHVEDICNEYIRPALQIRLYRVPWPGGEVGIVEAIREGAKVPYEVRRDVGPHKAGQIFVRHGTHITEPDAQELASLREEGRRARGEA